MTHATFDDPRFELRGRLGSGGMGTVHRAFDRLHGREVALKVGRPIDGDRDAARIGEEFALLASLDHAGLVRVLDFGLTAQAAWLSSEIVAGPRLDVWAGRGPSDDALTVVVADLIEMLAWLHARGLVHGDVKPANVLVGASGPVLIDFGLAGSGEALFGATRAYAAPELLSGGAPTPASDLFALGRTLQRLAGTRSLRIQRVVEALTADAPAARATAAQALALLGIELALPAPTQALAPWSGAVERALRALALQSERRPHLDVRVARAHRAGFLGALGARLMLAGRPTWRLPEGAGLEPFAQVAAALGVEVVLPSGTVADDQREVLDAFTDRLIGALRAVPASVRPLLLVADSDGLGAAGRFVLARVIEARALSGFAVVGGAQPLERGVESGFVRFEVLASEAEGRHWEADWSALSEEARGVARELWGLGGAARLDELGGASPTARHGATRRALIELQGALLTQRAADGRTALQADLLEAMGGVIAPRAPSERERRAWLQTLSKAQAPTEAMYRATARHALALGEARVAEVAFQESAAAAEAAFAWGRAGESWVEAARLRLAAGDAESTFIAARAALKALRAAGGGPLVEAALALAKDAALAVRGPDARDIGLEAALLRGRAALERGLGQEATAAADEVLAALGGDTKPWKLRFEALLVRGTALTQTEDRARAERDLSEAAALAEAAHDLHALGRTANNVGMLAFHRGDLDAAAAAWARAAEAKARTGDRRGERIGRHNRGLALRELGRLSEAETAANEAATLSDQIGDEVGRATAALAKAQLAIDRAAEGDAAAREQLPAADAALATFDEVGWKPAMVAADGRIVRVRLDLAKGALAEAERGATDALEAAIGAGMEPVAAEAWALLQVITRRPSAPPELVRGSLARAEGERGGLALLLVFARLFADAEAGRWGDARAALAHVVKRLAEGPMPPAARVGLPLAIAAARTLEPKVADMLEGLMQRRGPASDAGLGERVVGGAVDLAGWAARVRRATGASRVELVPIEGDAFVAADEGPPRFVDLGRRVARGTERFVALGADGRPQAVAVPLRLGEAPGFAVGALVAGFDGAGQPEALDGMGATLEVIALALGHDLERRRRERAEAEVVRLGAELRQHLERHEAEVTSLRDALEQSQSVLALRHDYGHIVHRSAAMRKILETLDKVTDRELPVLILGESGVGKELLARALHFNGPRAKKRFIAENCGAIPKDLFESQFFGHVKGAFTGALAPRQGLFEAAEGGTLFLDEIGELPLEMQVKLLRVLQDRTVRPVGSNREIAVDFRLVCATNRDLTQMVQEGRFREDLFYRIAVVKVEVPPLRKRPEDIVPIAERLLASHAERLGRVVRLTPEAADRLASHPFPGNVRELDNELLRALALSDGPEIKPRHLSAALQGRSEPRRKSGDAAADGALETLEAAFARIEKELLVRHLRASRGQKVAAAKTLGLSRPGLDAKLARHGVDAKELARSLKEPSR